MPAHNTHTGISFLLLHYRKMYEFHLISFQHFDLFFLKAIVYIYTSTLLSCAHARIRFCLCYSSLWENVLNLIKQIVFSVLNHLFIF